MSRREQLERVLKIDRMVRSGQYPNANSLAQELEVSRRVIFTDRRFLVEQLRAPLAFDRTRGGWYYSEPTWVLPTMMMKQGELLAFFLSVEVARHHVGTALEEPLLAAVEKISHSLQEPVPVDLEVLRTHYTFATPAMVATDLETLLALHRAIAARQAMSILYYTASRDEHNERIIHPHHLHNVEADWHLIAYDHLRGEMRTFNVGRIEEWRTLPQRFTREPGFNPQEWMQSVFQSERAAELVEIVIRFDSYQSRYIRERRWHETQQIEELAGGELIMRFQGSGLGEIRRWVMRYGSHAEVLAPASLRAEVAQEALRTAALYAPETAEPTTGITRQGKGCDRV